MTKEKTGYIKILRYLFVIFVFAFGFIAIVGTGGGGGGGGDNSSEDADDKLEIIPIPYYYLVVYEETQDPSTTPGLTIEIRMSTKNDPFDGSDENDFFYLLGSEWTGFIHITGSISEGGPVDMFSYFYFDLALQPNSNSNNLISEIIPITIEGTWTPVSGVPFTVTQDVELICYYYIGSSEMNIIVFVKEGTKCLFGFSCTPFAALDDINTTVPVQKKLTGN